MRVTITEQTADRVVCDTDIGQVRIHKHRYEFPRAFGDLPDRPWHVVCFGRNFCSPETAIAYLRSIDANADTTEQDAEIDYASQIYQAGYAYACGYRD